MGWEGGSVTEEKGKNEIMGWRVAYWQKEKKRRVRRKHPLYQAAGRTFPRTVLRLLLKTQFINAVRRHPASSTAQASLEPDQQLFITDRDPTSTNSTSGMAMQAWRMACREPWLLNLVRVGWKARLLVGRGNGDWGAGGGRVN